MQEPDWGAVRALFPVFRRWAHLNTAAFGPMPSTAVRAMNEHFTSCDESASLHFLSWFDRLDSIRAKIALLIGAEVDDIGFCPNAGTALSWLLHGIHWKSGDEILAVDHEFPNNLYAPHLLDAKGVRFRPVPTPPGCFDPEFFLNELRPHTRLVVLSSVNYSNGMRAPLEALAPELRRRGVLLCVDATQSVGVLRHDVRAIPADFLIVHGYKWMLGPAGSGFFYAPAGTREWLAPTVVSWRSHKEWRNHAQLHHGRPELVGDAAMYEGGVQAFGLLFALEASLDLILECGPAAIEKRALRLARETRELLASHGARDVVTEGRADDSQIVTASIPGRDPAALCEALDERRVAVSARKGNLRVSLHFFNNREDLGRLSEALAV